jgi:hypothetical protein
MRRKGNLSLRNGHLSLQNARRDSADDVPICSDQFAMTNLHWSVWATLFLAVFVLSSTCLAGGGDPPSRDRTSREIYVPFSDLHILLGQQPKRVLLSREEYDDLVRKAKKSPETHAPHSALIVSADYSITAGGQRAEIQGALSIDVLEDGLQVLPLDIASVGLHGATLDGRNASIGRDRTGQLVLFVEGKGQHKLKLELVAPLETTAARQVLNFRLPRPPAAKLRLTVTGDVEIKGGADVISRTVDAAPRVTRFELLPRAGDTSILMTLNSHLQRQDRAVAAHSVLVDEITQAYEKLYATVSMSVLFRAVDQLRFVVPEGFEITEVTSPLLARWDVQTEGGRKVLGVKLREQTTETVVLKIAAIRTPAKLDNWTAPRLEPLDVVGSAAVFGLLVEDRLNAESLSPSGLIPIETTVLSNVLPAALLESGPGRPALRAVAAWYAPQSDFALTAQFKKPPPELAVTTSLLLVLADKGQEVLGGLSFLPQVERRFSFDVAVPAGWQVIELKTPAGQLLPFEHYAAASLPGARDQGSGVRGQGTETPNHQITKSPNPKIDSSTSPHPNPLPKGEGTGGATRIRVTVPGGMAMGQEYKVNFRAVCVPQGWMADWKSMPVEFPKFAVLGATRDEGAIAVNVGDDLDVRPEKTPQLTPLEAAEKPKYGLADVSTRLAYRYESPKYAASLTVERTRPRVTARTISFVGVEPSALACYYELIYTIEEARAQRLAFVLPKDTPASVLITALDGVRLKEYTSEIVGDSRRWNVSLAEAAKGRIRLAVKFQMPLPSQKRKDLALPIVAAADVAYQSGLAAVEGCAELEVLVHTKARPADVGELADADHPAGSRLLGAYGFVGDPPPVTIDVLRHDAYTLCPAIVQQCELDTSLSPEGESQTRARFKLMTKALYLQIKLPPSAELWSAELDGTPLKPQRQGDSVLIDVPAGKTKAAQTLQLVYAARVDPVSLRGTVAVLAPKLLLRTDLKKAAVEVPLVDLVWRLHLPSGYDLVGSAGTVATDDIERPSPAAVEVGRFLLGCNSILARHSPASALILSAPAKRIAQSKFDAKAASCDHDMPYETGKGISEAALAAKIAELDKLLAETAANVKGKREALKSMMEQSGKPGADVLTTQQKLKLEELQLHRTQEANLQYGIATAKGELAAQKAILRNTDAAGIPAADLNGLIKEDPVAAQLMTQLADKQRERQSNEGVAKPGVSSGYFRHYDDEISNLQGQYNARVATIQRAAREKKRQAVETEIVRLDTQLKSMAQNRAAVQKNVKGLTNEAADYGVASVGMEMLRSDIEHGERVMSQIAAERERLAIRGRGPAGGKDAAQAGAPLLEALEETAAAHDRRPESGETEKQADEKTAMGGSRVDVPHDETLPSPYYQQDGVKYVPKTPGMSQPGVVSADGTLPAKSGQDLIGNRSLKIEVVQAPAGTDRVATFHSLGVEPTLVVTLANQSRLSLLGWGLALLVGLIGVAKTGRPAGKKTAFVLAVAVIATVVPLLTGSSEVVQLCNMAFYAACVLVVYYLAVGVLWAMYVLAQQSCACCTAKLPTPPAPASPMTSALLIALLTGGLLASLAVGPQAASAAENAPGNGPYVIQVVEPGGPVSVPEDAVIFPYDPDWKNTIKDADRVLVPYDRYVELWNAVHPDKKIETKDLPAAFALAGATYKTLLEGEDYLLVTGQLEIDVFADGLVPIPLGLGGGVLAQAELDGKPARMRAGVSDPFGNRQQKSIASAADRSLVVLYVSGKGRHKLDLSVHLKLFRQGGWRLVQGVLPAAPASAISIVVPKPKTELRLGQVLDRRKYDTEKPDETIRTALGPGGTLGIQWRPVVAEGQTDHSLTAVSAAVLDAQEDGLRLTWRLGVEFRGTQRERFSVTLPDGYLLAKVEGNNVRGWEQGRTTAKPTVEVTLLQPAKDYEQFTLRLLRAGAVGQKDLAQFDVPQVTIADAALHTGQLTIRRSPLLELRTLDRSGVTRTDLPPDAGAVAAGGEESPLGIRPFEAYTFAAVPFKVHLAAAPVAAQVSATVQTVLKLAEFERLLESRVLFDVQDRPAFQFRMLLPNELRDVQVSAPGEFTYAVTKQNGRRLLTVYLAIGRQGETAVVVRGRLGREKAIAELPLPRLEVLDVRRQQGDVAVQADPAFDVDAVGLSNCEPVLLGQLSGWLKPEQQQGTRLALHYRQGDYAGTLRLRLRKPEVTCDTITNVRLTDRALEETIFLNFNVTNAGIRRLSFLLPADMADARISSVPMSRQKPMIEPVGKEPNSPLRVSIELQEEKMGEIHVLVKNDRLFAPGSHEAPIPRAEGRGDGPPLVTQTGTVPYFRMGSRYVVIENAGRDEVVVEADKLREMEPLGSRQKQWAMLKDILGREMTMAYLVSPDARSPRLAYHTESHAAVTTVKARIGLAEATLVIDDNGAYRARQVYRMDNATEQFLEIQLPEGAELWTAYVAGTPVKPIKQPGAADSQKVWIPIIKTAAGELSYEVVLKYGGAMPRLGALGNVTFPLIRSKKITPDLSQVKLFVPRDQRWFGFGGTMRRVVEEADLQAGYMKFQTQQTKQIGLAFHEGDKWTKARAGVNLQVQLAQVSEYRATLSSSTVNPSLRSELESNTLAMREVAEEVAKQERAAPAEEMVQDNRQRLELAYGAQQTRRARNVVNELGNNWNDVNALAQGSAKPEGALVPQFNDQWMVQNKFAGETSIQRAGGKGPTARFGKGDQPADKSGPWQGGGNDYGGCVGRHSPLTVQANRGQQAVQLPSFAQVVVNSANPSTPVQCPGTANMAVPTVRDGEALNVQTNAAPGMPPQGTPGFSFAAGVNSDAGLVGSVNLGQQQVILDGQNLQVGQMVQASRGEDESLKRYKARLNVNAGQTEGWAQGQTAGVALNRMPGPGDQSQLIAKGLYTPSRRSQVRLGVDTYAQPAETPAVPVAVPGAAACMPPPPTTVPAGGMGGMQARGEDQKGEERQIASKPNAAERANAVQQAAAGLASLDFDLPAAENARWKVYRFTTPLGDQEITARNASNDLVRRLIEIAVVAGVLLLLWAVVAAIRHGLLRGLERPLASTLLICLGVVLLCSGLLPIVGVLAITVGCGLTIHRWTSPATAA